jgi:hypothetical protein
MKRLLSIWVALLLAGLSSVYAEKVVLQIKVENPRDIQQTAQIHSCLPSEIRPNDILNSQGLGVLYDIKKKTYAVHQKIELDPYEKRTYDITLKDVWQIPDKTLADLNNHAEALFRKLKRDTSDSQKLISSIRKAQNANHISRVKANTHITAYRENLTTLNRVKTALSQYENELIKKGKDPGRITHGLTKYQYPEYATSKTSIIQIKVTNTSPTSSRKVPIHRELPEEILPNDIISTDGLEIRVDQAKGVCYLYKDFVELEANASASFDIRIKDKWDIQDQHIKALKAETHELLTGIQFWRRYPSVEEELKTIDTRLDAISNADKPTEFSAAYIAFFRDQTAALSDTALALTRIKNIPFPSGGLGTPTQPPSRSTTWMIIYIILAMLAIASIIALSGCRLRDTQLQDGISCNI